MEEETKLGWVNPGVLSPVVRNATGRPHGEVASWTTKRIYGGIGRGLGVFRVVGEAVDRGEPFTWSVVVKVVGVGRGAVDNPAAWNYWKREALAFESRALEQLPGGVVAPRCWGVTQLEVGAVAIWLEELRDDGPSSWSLADYGQAARHFGCFNAAYLRGERPLDHSWYSHDWMKGRVEACATPVALLLEHRDNPWIQRMHPPDVLERILRVWEEREWFYRVIAGLPQTFCHQDAFRRNLFRRGHAHEETVAIDWAGAGIAPIGAEMVPLVVTTVGMHEFEVERWRELEGAALAGYLQGLNEGGWKGDPRLPRLGYAASVILRFGVPGNLQVATLLNEQQWPELEKSVGCPIGELCDFWAHVRRSVVLPFAEEAHTLSRDLRLSVLT